jgi:hypothetical protein
MARLPKRRKLRAFNCQECLHLCTIRLRKVPQQIMADQFTLAMRSQGLHQLNLRKIIGIKFSPNNLFTVELQFTKNRGTNLSNLKQVNLLKPSGFCTYHQA